MRPMRVRGTARILILGVALFLCGGCSLLFTKGPPAGHETMATFQCTESTTGPIVDIVVGALNLVGAVAIAGDRNQYDHPDEAIASGAIWAVVLGVSAGVGFDRVHRCVAAKRQLAARQAPAPGGVAEGAGVRTVLVWGDQDTLPVGESVQLTAKAFDAGAAVLVGRTFRWSSSNDAIASVSNSGLLTTRAPGAVVIAANADNVVGTMRVVVVPKP